MRFLQDQIKDQESIDNIKITDAEISTVMNAYFYKFLNKNYLIYPTKVPLSNFTFSISEFFYFANAIILN